MTQAAPRGIFSNQAERKPLGQQAGRGDGVPTGTSPELATLLSMDHVIRGASPESLCLLPALEAAVTRADAIERLRDALTDDVMHRFYPLMNTSLGFRTDRPSKKNPEPYSVNEVRNCMVEALLIGLRLTDNEWNIISQRCYVTREGFSRLLREHRGLTDLKIVPGVPNGDKTRGVTIAYHCTWRLNGVEQTLDVVIPVSGGEYATLDQLLGKGDRKVKARIWAKVTGSEVSADGEVEIEDVAAAKPDHANAALASLKQNGNGEARKPTEKPAETTKAKEPAQAPSNGEAHPEAATSPQEGRVSGDANAQPPSGWTSVPSKPKPGEQPAPWET